MGQSKTLLLPRARGAALPLSSPLRCSFTICTALARVPELSSATAPSFCPQQTDSQSVTRHRHFMQYCCRICQQTASSSAEGHFLRIIQLTKRQKISRVPSFERDRPPGMGDPPGGRSMGIISRTNNAAFNEPQMGNGMLTRKRGGRWGSKRAAWGLLSRIACGFAHANRRPAYVLFPRP